MLFLLSLLFACFCFLHYWRVVILTAPQTTTVVCSSVCTDRFQWLFLVERGTGRNEHSVVVEWISARMWCLVSARSSSLYVLYLFVRFCFGLLSTCCATSGWLFEISLCENSINQNQSMSSTNYDVEYISGMTTAHYFRNALYGYIIYMFVVSVLRISHDPLLALCM